jgi:hypothetical protein
MSIFQSGFSQKFSNQLNKINDGNGFSDPDLHINDVGMLVGSREVGCDG